MRRSTVLKPPASLVMEQRQDVAPGQLPAAVQEAELDDEPQPGDLGPEPLDQPDGGRRRAPGGEDVVDDQDLLVDGDGVAVQLEQAGAVLQLVGLGLDLPRQLPDLADGHEAGPEPVGDGGGDDEPPGLDADDLGDAETLEAADDRIDHEREALRVGQEGRDVLEDDPGLGEVGDVPDQVFQARNVRLHTSSVPAGPATRRGWDFWPFVSAESTVSVLGDERESPPPVRHRFLAGALTLAG